MTLAQKYELACAASDHDYIQCPKFSVSLHFEGTDMRTTEFGTLNIIMVTCFTGEFSSFSEGLICHSGFKFNV